MILTDELKIIDNKIKVNQAQYDLEKQLQFLHYHLKNWISINISLASILQIE